MNSLFSSKGQKRENKEASNKITYPSGDRSKESDIERQNMKRAEIEEKLRKIRDAKRRVEQGLYRPSGWTTMSPEEKLGHANYLRDLAHRELKINTVDKYNFAMIGSAGVGKSSLINALCLRKDIDQGAAPVGEANETTLEIKPYQIPSLPNVVLWDIPGTGTVWNPAAEYFMKHKLYAFDMLIIMTTDRFTENDYSLGATAKGLKTPFVYVRNKCDLHVESKMKRDSTLTREKAFKKLKEETQAEIKPYVEEFGLGDVKLFCISAWAFSDESVGGKYSDEKDLLLYIVLEAAKARH